MVFSLVVVVVVSLLFSFLFLPHLGSTSSCDVCYSTTHAWMGELYNISINSTFANNPNYTAWSDRRLNEILVPGSHDAGLYTIVSKSALGVLFPDNVFFTQSRDLHDQACAGSRFYDIRFSKATGVWRIFHSPAGTPGVAPAAYSIDIDTACNQITTFLDHPEHSREILMWRIKIEEQSLSGEISTILRNKLLDYMLDFNGTVYYNLTLSQIWGKSPTKGKLIVLSYGWTPSPLASPNDTARGTIYNYQKNQLGRYSDALTMENMLGRCKVGQIERLLMYKAANESDHLLYGIWWTFTTENVKENTNDQWARFPNALNDFYVTSNGEIGNVFVVDFFGDRDKVMNIVWDYNYYKFASFPPKSPTEGYTLLNNPELPGKSIFSSPSDCYDVQGATHLWIVKIIVITVFVILMVMFIVCGIPCIAFYCHKQKEKITTKHLNENLI